MQAPVLCKPGPQQGVEEGEWRGKGGGGATRQRDVAPVYLYFAGSPAGDPGSGLEAAVLLASEVVEDGPDGEAEEREHASERDDQADDGAEAVGGFVAPVGAREVGAEVLDVARVGRDEGREDSHGDVRGEDDHDERDGDGRDARHVHRGFVLLMERGVEVVAHAGDGSVLHCVVLLGRVGPVGVHARRK